jgi:hypothetical protein
MLPLRRSVTTRLAGGLIAGVLALAAAVFAIPAVHPATGQARTAAQDDAAISLAGVANLGGGCSYHQITGGYQWVCTNTSTTPGGQATGQGGGSKPTCTLTPLSQAQASYLGLQWPAPAGHTWEAITCPGTQPFGGVVLAGGTPAAPAVSLQDLVQFAEGQLQTLPLPVQTAPPRGHDGLVGLPEWYWVTDWHPVQTNPPKIQAGPVWVIATATPESIIINPGGGLAPVTCPTPGTPYNPALPLSQQHTDCSYTYQQPSAGQPGNAYAASVTVLWTISWRGSGDTHGTVATARQVTTALVPGIRVAAAQALVTGP